MSEFIFSGEIPASKSVLGRALVMASYQPALKVIGDSNCDDVRLMREGLGILQQKKSGSLIILRAGFSAAVFRFLAFKASRVAGEYFILAEPDLLRRPQKELCKILGSLGVHSELRQAGLHILSTGWKKPESTLEIDSRISSQFMSGVMLNSWNLDFDLKLGYDSENASSYSYFCLTLEMLQKAGMKIETSTNSVLIKAHQQAKPGEIRAELDMSTAFVMAAFGALLGKTTITNYTTATAQPDSCFIGWLTRMGVSVKVRQSEVSAELLVRKIAELMPLSADLKNSPDLFPVLSVLCAFARGKSILHGAPQLAHKESNRILKTAQLLSLAGVSVRVRDDGLEIDGGLGINNGVDFDPENDHRMAMAARLLSQAAFLKINILNRDCVNKSYPEFWVS